MENFDLPPTPLPSPTPSFPTPPPKHTKKTFTDKTHHVGFFYLHRSPDGGRRVKKKEKTGQEKGFLRSRQH